MPMFYDVVEAAKYLGIGLTSMNELRKRHRVFQPQPSPYLTRPRYHSEQLKIIEGVILGSYTADDGMTLWEAKRSLIGKRIRQYFIEIEKRARQIHHQQLQESSGRLERIEAMLKAMEITIDAALKAAVHARMDTFDIKDQLTKFETEFQQKRITFNDTSAFKGAPVTNWHNFEEAALALGGAVSDV